MGRDFLLELANPPAFVLAGFALGVVLRLADRLADTTFACRESSSTSACNFRRCDSSSTNRANIDLHAAAVAVLLNELRVFQNESLDRAYAANPATSISVYSPQRTRRKKSTADRQDFRIRQFCSHCNSLVNLCVLCGESFELLFGAVNFRQFLPQVAHWPACRGGSRRARISRWGCACCRRSGPSPAAARRRPVRRVNVLTIGIEPPSRMNTGARPKPASIAAAAARMYGLSSGTTTPGAP